MNSPTNRLNINFSFYKSGLQSLSSKQHIYVTLLLLSLKALREFYNANTSQGWWRKEGRVEENKRMQRGLGLEPGTYCVLGENPQLHAAVIV